MRDPAVEERVGPGRLLIHMRVERVPGELGEMLDVLERHLARAGHDGIPRPELGQRLTERVPAAAVTGSARNPLAGYRGEHPRAGLHRRALHVVQHAAYPA